MTGEAYDSSAVYDASDEVRSTWAEQAGATTDRTSLDGDDAPLEARDGWARAAVEADKRAGAVEGTVCAGCSLADVLRHFSVALRRLRHDGGILVAHLLENDAGLLHHELQRVEAEGDAALLAALATDGVCTLQAASVQQARDPISRTEAELRAPGFGAKCLIALSPACQMYGVPPLVERGDGFCPHTGFNAETAGRLYFAMRGIRYRGGVRRAPRRPDHPRCSAVSGRTGD